MLKGPQTPPYGYPARASAPTQRHLARATHDGRRGPFASNAATVVERTPFGVRLVHIGGSRRPLQSVAGLGTTLRTRRRMTGGCAWAAPTVTGDAAPMCRWVDTRRPHREPVGRHDSGPSSIRRSSPMRGKAIVTRAVPPATRTHSRAHRPPVRTSPCRTRRSGRCAGADRRAERASSLCRPARARTATSRC